MCNNSARYLASILAQYTMISRLLSMCPAIKTSLRLNGIRWSSGLRCRLSEDVKSRVEISAPAYIALPQTVRHGWFFGGISILLRPNLWAIIVSCVVLLMRRGSFDGENNAAAQDT